MALKIKSKVFPSIKYEAIIHCGPEKIPSQAVNAKKLQFSLKLLLQKLEQETIKKLQKELIKLLTFFHQDWVATKYSNAKKAIIKPIIFLEELFLQVKNKQLKYQKEFLPEQKSC